MKVNFQVVELKFSKSGICPACGKSAIRTKKFFQTLNPFNKNDDGSVKTRDQIMVELSAQASKYRSETIYHAKCED